MSLDEKLNRLSARHQNLERDMAANPDPATYGKLAAEYSELGPVVAKIGQLRSAEKSLAGVDELLSDRSTDAEMRQMAESERPELVERIEELRREISMLLLPRDAADEQERDSRGQGRNRRLRGGAFCRRPIPHV